MNDSTLRQHWLEALGAAAGAVDAATGAHAVAPEVVRAERRRLRAERAWVESVEWGALERRVAGAVVRLDSRRRGDLGRRMSAA